MKNYIPNGVWPTMITPFSDGKVDYNALENLIAWYIKNGVAGLFAVCQSSEMFKLSLEERIEIAKFVKKITNGQVPVIASGHISEDLYSQLEEVNRMAETGIEAVVLITNRFAARHESDDIWKANLEEFLKDIPQEITLGFYECPYPYKRVLSSELMKWCAETGRFTFLKDTSCDLENIKEKLIKTKGTGLKLFNANTATLLASLKIGANGYSGVMANFHPDLYVWLCNNWDKSPEKASELQNILSMCALIEKQLYPVNAKYYMKLEGQKISCESRTKNANELTETYKLEVQQLRNISKKLSKEYPISSLVK
ncbi:4-hydroxy-tetrahydrodipicolinate synthase [Anaerovirgula multivorans]|uniref:4-hydroxy-tetrahydrodipicolinate synthase n=1 Tax=Anaerovirgula multivorans TaxID=312168 RepID=A0A239AZ27_9FIRM|nr:dihydrodipicolinate synthase family protein [Anaerovirgula multivorans]SNS00274.1 4-hydroxy-tetrahydrodipicolinate synthase [Anaerovirgula multivorans]